MAVHVLPKMTEKTEPRKLTVRPQITSQDVAELFHTLRYVVVLRGEEGGVQWSVTGDHSNGSGIGGSSRTDHSSLFLGESLCSIFYFSEFPLLLFWFLMIPKYCVFSSRHEKGQGIGDKRLKRYSRNHYQVAYFYKGQHISRKKHNVEAMKFS